MVLGPFKFFMLLDIVRFGCARSCFFQLRDSGPDPSGPRPPDRFCSTRPVTRGVGGGDWNRKRETFLIFEKGL